MPSALKVLANENFPGDAVAALRERGHDVLWAREAMAGAADELILARARDESRILLTFDKDFGELVFRRGRDGSAGIVLFRIHMPSSRVAAGQILTTLESRDDWGAHFSVVEDGRVRMSPLPSQQ